jgi:two-component system, OmpR family, sensor kinase
LLDQLARVREAERAFAANSAHELRTPIAAAQAQLQRLTHDFQSLQNLAAIDPQQRQNLSLRVDAISRQLQRLQHLCVKLLQLSRADAGIAQLTTPVNLDDLARLVLGEYQNKAQGHRLVLEVPDADACPSQPLTGMPSAAMSPARAAKAKPAMALGDLDTLGIALRNLIENALLHSGEGSLITVRVTHLPSIEVIDNGPGIPSGQLGALTQPFQRGQSSAQGHGLGLSIVSAIALQMGGQLELFSPHVQGHGLHARLRLRDAWAPNPQPAQASQSARKFWR